MKSYTGKVAVVTGAGGNGIGHALAVELGRRGARVAFCDIKGLESTTDALSGVGAESYAEEVDVSDKEAIDRFVEHVTERFGGIDVLINNAGIPLGDLTFDEVSREDFERITAINYWGVIHTTQVCYEGMSRRPEAAVVNISSAQGSLALPYLVPYCTTKFAVRGFTDALRAEHHVRGIKNFSVHTVQPGAVATDITKNADYQNSSSDRFHDDLQKGATPAEAANTILDGVLKGKGRIFISDGFAHDLLSRLLPARSPTVVKLIMRLRGISPR